MQLLRILLIIVLSVVTLSSCHISRKKNPTTGPVVIVKDSKAGHHKDHRGYKKGWTKNPNNPHHPRTTNPGHTKNGKAGGNTVIIVNNNNTTVKQAAPKGQPGKGGKHHNGGKGNGNQGNGGKGNQGKGGKK